MDAHLYTVEKTKRTDGTERFEIHLGNAIYILSLVGGEKLAKKILLLLRIDVAQLEADKRRLRQHMDWLTNRLINVYGESENVDWAHKTRRLLDD